jgi:ethanolamine ammonia-lyase small subunit
MSIVSEETLRSIVKSVISTMNEDKIQEKKQEVEAKHDKEEWDECIENITSEEYKKKILVNNPKDMNALQLFKNSTPARIGVGRAGDRPLTETLIRFRADHAAAIDSVFSEVDEKLLDELKLIKLKSKVKNKDEHITRPDLGRDLDDESVKLLREKCAKNPQVQVIVSDGLSSKAIEANIKDVLPAFLQGLSVYDIKVGTPVFVKYGRVGVMDAIGEEIGADAAILFVGERPGLATAESMSAYMVYHPKRDMNEAERTVLSNIHKGGTPPVEAGAHIATLMKRILDEKASGVNMKK